MRREAYIGPIPPPEMLAKYNEIDPGFAGRIMNMAEGEQSHRHKTEKGMITQVGRGSLFAFLPGMAGIASTTYLLMNGVSWPSIFIVPGSLIPSALSRIWGRKEVSPPGNSG